MPFAEPAKGNPNSARLFLTACAGAASAATVSAAATLPSLEELAYNYGTDKSHDDHKYVDLYASLFDPIRETVLNVTEIGVSAGQSMLMWHDYFTRATIHGVDIVVYASTRKHMASLPRAKLYKLGSTNTLKLERLGLAPASMDIILDDGDHFPLSQMHTLSLWWPFVRAGGYYIIEDVATGANRRNQQRYLGSLDTPGYSQLAHNQSLWDEAARTIMHQHDTFFVDSQVGHRAFDLFRERSKLDHGPYMKDEVNHNSHVLVIRKRATPRTRPIHVFRGTEAMRGKAMKQVVRQRASLLSGS